MAILNQLYREGATRRDRPDIEGVYQDILKFTHHHRVYKDNGRPVGRIYDQAILYQQVPDWRGKRVCELGGRDGLFASWITREAAEVAVSDYFEEWGKGTADDLGSFLHWKGIWERCAVNPDRLRSGVEDITRLSFPDNYFDVVISTSVIEHLHNQCEWMGDMVGIREMARILKPGGYLLLSTDMTDRKSKWHSGTFYYNETDLFDRVINPSRCRLIGDHDFRFDHPDNTDVRLLEPVGRVSSVVFALRKPEEEARSGHRFKAE
jgi:SAM-dependent methyltransferase